MRGATGKEHCEAARRSFEPRRLLAGTAVGALLALQVALALQGIADVWVRGHNGWNSAAYNQAARNTLRWGTLFPVEYATGASPPAARDLYTHHPLALHLHTVAAVALLGDAEWASRLVPALHAVLSALVLYLVVRRWWGGLGALLALAVYVLHPINAVYTNMSNHQTGFFVWVLLLLHAYLRYQGAPATGEPPPRDGASGGGKRLLLVLAALVMAAMWDWPTYYVVAVLAAHWVHRVVARRRRDGRAWWPPGRDHGPVLAFGATALLCLAGHLALVARAVGGTGELLATLRARQSAGYPFGAHLRVVPELMFTYPLLGVGLAWLAIALVRFVGARGRARDVVPFSLFLAGTIHYLVFKQSAVMHEYWGWTLVPFVAIATAEVVPAAGALLGRGRPAARACTVGLCAAAVLVPLALRDAAIVPAGRAVGGSMWFVAPTRGPVQAYDSGRADLLFAKEVHRRTDRRTGVLMRGDFDARRVEPRFLQAMDRETVTIWRLPDELPVRPNVDRWVLIAPAAALAPPSKRALAAHHPFLQYGDRVMVDLSTDGACVEVYDLVPDATGGLRAFLESPYEPDLRAVRRPDEEARLRPAGR